MRIFTKAALAFGLAACLSTTANAQGPGRGGFGGGAALLSNKEVQKELKLTDEQIEKADKAGAEMREKMTEKFQDLRDLEAGERREKMASLQKEMAAESKKVAEEILKPEQAKRLEQISLQFAFQQGGALALANPEIQAKLKITDEQKNKLKDLSDDMNEKRRELGQSAQDGGDPQEMAKKRQALQKEGAEKVMSLMTDDQKKTWKELTGEPFEVRMEPRRRPGAGQ